MAKVQVANEGGIESGRRHGARNVVTGVMMERCLALLDRTGAPCQVGSEGNYLHKGAAMADPPRLTKTRVQRMVLQAMRSPTREKLDSLTRHWWSTYGKHEPAKAQLRTVREAIEARRVMLARNNPR